MTTTADRIDVRTLEAKERAFVAPLCALLATAATAAAVWGATLPGADVTRWIGAGAVVVWALSSLALSLTRRGEPLALLVGSGALAGGVFVAMSAARAHQPSLAGAAWILAPLALASMPALFAHLLLALPDGRLHDGGRRAYAIAGYVLALAVAVMLRLQRPHPHAWPAIALGLALLPAAIALSSARYQRARGIERQRMQWFGWGVTVGAWVCVVALVLRVLLGWPHNAGVVVACALVLVPVSLAFGASQKLVHRVDRMLAATVAFSGLTGVVGVTYLLIVVGLGRVPTDRERTIIGLSMAAAVVAALLYLPTRERLARIANKIAYGERHAPDEALRTFGSRLSRAVPLDELLLQMAESLRKTLALDAVEVWTGSEGSLERAASDPERGHARMTIGPQEQPVVARAGVSGPAWIKVWLPALLETRADRNVRVAPITHQGQLLGLIIAERRADEQFVEEEERVMTELARQVGLALHNVQLDSALQASLDELKRQAEDLRASRQRIVVAADAARRKIERDLHDGAQQHLVALKVKLRLAKQLAEADANAAQSMLDELSGDVQATIDELRALSHGIYPPVLADRGLVPALEAAANRAAIPTTVAAAGEQARYRPEIEAAIYFCCLESLNNAAKHAGEGARARITLEEEAGLLRFAVADDGAGFDVHDKGIGAGFTNLADRLGAVGGSLRVESAPGEGTQILGRVPIE